LLLHEMSRRSDTAPGGGAFIESYIAPDMHMRPVAETVDVMQDTGFEVRDVEAMREHHVQTVQAWRRNFDHRYGEFVALQGGEGARVWQLYLTGGGLAYAEGRIGVDQPSSPPATASSTTQTRAPRSNWNRMKAEA
jgi:cyclopropane-fatty-acyl-phospholipid synthase